MKYLVITLTALAILSVGLYLVLTYYRSSPKFPEPVSRSTNSNPQITSQISADQTNPGDDLTALDRDLTETDNLDTNLDGELNKI